MSPEKSMPIATATQAVGMAPSQDWRGLTASVSALEAGAYELHQIKDTVHK